MSMNNLPITRICFLSVAVCCLVIMAGFAFAVPAYANTADSAPQPFNPDFPFVQIPEGGIDLRFNFDSQQLIVTLPAGYFLRVGAPSAAQVGAGFTYIVFWGNLMPGGIPMRRAEFATMMGGSYTFVNIVTPQDPATLPWFYNVTEAETLLIPALRPPVNVPMFTTTDLMTIMPVSSERPITIFGRFGDYFLVEATTAGEDVARPMLGYIRVSTFVNGAATFSPPPLTGYELEERPTTAPGNGGDNGNDNGYPPNGTDWAQIVLIVVISVLSVLIIFIIFKPVKRGRRYSAEPRPKRRNRYEYDDDDDDDFD